MVRLGLALTMALCIAVSPVQAFNSEAVQVMRELFALLETSPYGQTLREWETETCVQSPEPDTRLKQSDIMNNVLDEVASHLRSAEEALLAQQNEEAERLMALATLRLSQYRQMRDCWYRYHFPLSGPPKLDRL